MKQEEVDNLKQVESFLWQQFEESQKLVISIRDQWERAHEARKAAEQELSRELYDPIEKGG